jgi:ATP-dependent Lon protease
MRPIIFVGEKGCGKTTAVRMLVEEALQIPTEIIKVPQTDGGHGMTGDCGVYQSSDVGCIARARLRANSLLVAYIFDEIDKVTHDRNRANVDDELLSITDESNTDVFDNYLETTLVGLEHCPMFFTANDIQKVNPILVDRCMVITFPNASASRIKSISKKYAEKKLSSSLYSMIEFNYELMYKTIDRLVDRNITSLRKHQQMIEAVLENALDVALIQEDSTTVAVTESMFSEAEQSILGTAKRKVGFST